jgi:hypothetical protein
VSPDDKAFFLPMAQADNYVAIPPNDMRTLIEYCGLKSRDKALAHARADKVIQIAKSARTQFQDQLAE